MQKLLTVLTCAFMCMTACMAEEPVIFEHGGIYYWIHTPGEIAVVNPLAIVGNEDEYTGDIEIPSTVRHDNQELIVTAIAKQAFNGYAITSVSIPPTVKSMGLDAFADCDDLTAVYISDLSAWCHIEFDNSYSNPLFFARHLFLGNDELSALTIPEDVTSVGEFTFKKCLSIRSVDFGRSVTTVAANAFYGCNNIETVVIPDNVTEIGETAFWSCSSLKNVSCGSGLKKAGRRIFEYTPWERALPDGAVYLGGTVLYWFKGLPVSTSLDIDEGVAAIAGDALYNTTFKSITFPSTLEWIGAYALHGCASLESVSLTSVRRIANNAFFRCTSLRDVELGNAIDSIEASVFAGCTSLRAINIPETATSIGASAFRECASLKTVNIGNGVRTIGHAAFTGCTGLRKIELPSNVTEIGTSAFAGCTNLSSITIGSGTKSIGYSAFFGCSNLATVNIEDSSIPLSLSHNSEPYGHDTGQGLFADATLTSLYLGRNLVFENDAHHGTSPFHNQNYLEDITIGPNVTEIPSTLFSGCGMVYTVTSMPAIPPYIHESATLPFDENVFTQASLIVPNASVHAYASANCWRKFNHIIGNESSTHNLEATAFQDHIDVSGRIMTVKNGIASVYTADGRNMAIGIDGEYTFPRQGIYIISIAGETHPYKVVIK